jgi:hypothetical protein
VAASVPEMMDILPSLCRGDDNIIMTMAEARKGKYEASKVA